MLSNSIFATKISSKERYSLLGINIMTYFLYGVLGGSFGVVFVTLRTNFDFTTNQMSAGLSIQAVGGCISSLIAIFALDKFNRQVQFCLVTLFLGLSILVLPFSRFFSLFLLINGLIGFFCTLIDCILNAWVVELFRPQEHLFIQILHFFYSFGTTISPFLLGPYLNKNETKSDESFEKLFNNSHTTTIDPFDNLQTSSEIDDNLPVPFLWISEQVRKSYIWIPMVILGASMLVSSITHVVAYLIKPYKELEKKKQPTIHPLPSTQDLNNNLSQMHIEKSSNNLIPISEICMDGHEKKSKNLSRGYHIFFVAMIVLIVTFEVSNEVNALNYLTLTIKTAFTELDEEQSGYVNSILQLVVTGARFLNIFLSFKVNVVANIFFNFAAMLAGCLLLMVSISKNLLAFEIGIALLGLGYSSTFPLLISFVEQRITLTNRVSSIMAFSSVFGLCVTPFIIGNYIDENPISFVYISFCIALVSFFSFTFLYVMEVLRLRRV